ncbi:ubinuclein-1 [Aplysia californica]|uniref:Ubinuclein-1 n=1 Tax=Aplysia californica TaxID=6500 RepID=A0ABM1A578_APLCA|nr:ubinuclein-1 [Aplysia californica]
MFSLSTDVKRIQLKPCEPTKVDKKVKKRPKTHRFVLSLGESNSKTCPEYSFADLVKNERQKSSQSSDPFGDQDEELEVASIAQRFEAKYGSKAMQSGKRKRTTDMDDYFDLGDGYDTDDPFIDNSEAYDEVVPSTLTTQYGGFYINMGKLDFKSVFDDSLDKDDFASPQGMKKKKKKQPLDSESEEETGETIAKKFKAMKRKKLLEKRESEKKKTKLSNGQEAASEIVVKKKKKKNLEKLKNKNVGDRQKTAAPVPVPVPVTTAAASTPSAPMSVTTTSSTATATAAAVVNSTAVVATTAPATPVSTVTSNSSAVASSAVVSSTTTATAAVVDVPPPPVKCSLTDNLKDAFESILQDSMKEDSSSRSGTEETPNKGDQNLSAKSTQLPSQLPSTLLEAIDRIKKEAKESKEGKSKFFSAEVNRLLLEIELGSRNLPGTSRTTIFNHLGEHLPCGKQAIQRRAKKLRESQQEDQLKGPTQKLKDAILNVMPAQVEAHEAEVAKAKLEAGEDGNEAAKDEASTESEGEDKAVDVKKKSKLPRRKFRWTPEIKELLLNVVSTKMKLFNTCRSRNETAEDYLKTYLDKEIKPIWPQGWMQTRMLFKESKAVHEEFTKAGAKKPAMSMRKLASPAPEVTATPSNAETPRTHVTKTEDVIEISSSTENHAEHISDVVINLPNSEPKTALPLSSGAVGGTLANSKLLDVALLSAAGSRSGKSGGAKAPSALLPSHLAVSQSQKTSGLSVKPGDSAGAKKLLSPSVSVIEIPDSPDSKTPTLCLPSAGSSTKVSSSTMPGMAYTPQSSGSNMGGVSSSSPRSNERSFMAAFNDFITYPTKSSHLPSSSGKNSTAAGSSSAPVQQQQQQQSPGQHQQHLQQLSSSLQAKSSQQQKSSQLQKLSLSSQQHPKVSTLQHKSGNATQHQKLSQDSKMASVSLKAAISPTVVNREHPNSSWANVNSIFPKEKSISPVVAISRIPATFSNKLSVSAAGKSSFSSPHSTSLPPQSSQQKTKASFSSSKTVQNQMYKRQFPAGLFPSSHSNLSDKSAPQTVGKFSAGDQSKRLGGGMASPNSNPSLVSVGTAPRSMQKATVLGTSMPDFLQKQQRLGLAGSSALPPSSSSSQLSIQTSPSSSSAKNSAGYPALPRGNMAAAADFMKQPSPPGRPVVGSSLSAGAGGMLSSSSGSSGLLRAGSGPSAAARIPGAAVPAASSSTSRGDTPSPQKSPVSPGNAALSLYEQIQSQIRNQEAMEGQALKNLAMALTFGGAAGPLPGKSGTGAAPKPQTGKR